MRLFARSKKADSDNVCALNLRTKSSGRRYFARTFFGEAEGSGVAVLPHAGSALGDGIWHSDSG